MGTKGHKLTAKMISFIDCYMVSSNAVQAVKDSAYRTANPKDMAAQLMGHPLIVEEIKKRMAARSVKAEIRADWIINKLIEVIENPEVKTTDMLRAIELAGKSIALWKERQEISGPDGEAIRHEQTIKENAADFTSRISGLAKRSATNNVVDLPLGRGKGTA